MGLSTENVKKVIEIVIKGLLGIEVTQLSIQLLQSTCYGREDMWLRFMLLMI